MPDGTTFSGYYDITDQTASEDPFAECSCGVPVWNVALHIEFHRSFGHVVTDKREPR